MVEDVWSLLCSHLANRPRRTIEDVNTAVHHRLRVLQHQPATINGTLTATGLDLEPP